jgi:hypothetical protein
MSDRVALLETLSRIEGNIGIAKWFLTNEDDDVKVALELLGRANLIEAKLVELRALLASDEESAKRNVHLIGDRPSPDAA